MHCLFDRIQVIVINTNKGVSIMKNTVQKDIILNAVLNSRNHPTADEIYSSLKEEHPRLSLGTVYRNLNAFAEQGLIVKFTPPKGSAHFDFNTQPHEHIVCEVCGKTEDVFTVLDFSDCAKNLGYDISYHSLAIYGKCASCK